MTQFVRMQRCARWAVLLVGIVAGCKNETEAPAPLGKEYYPVATGTYRTFAAEDVIWDDNVATTTQYQLRERIEDTFTDAAGQLSYRIVRSRREKAAEEWADDSVFVLTPTSQSLQLLRGNRRTVELVFPVREGKRWNPYAFAALDTVGRQYQNVGKPFKAGDKEYAETLTTLDDVENNLYYLTQRKQVYARNEGPIFRETKRFIYCDGSTAGQDCQVGTGYILAGREHRETLLESGKL